MSMHVPALHAPPVADDDTAAATAERYRRYVESILTIVVTTVVIAGISLAGVVLELG